MVYTTSTSEKKNLKWPDWTLLSIGKKIKGFPLRWRTIKGSHMSTRVVSVLPVKFLQKKEKISKKQEENKIISAKR